MVKLPREVANSIHYFQTKGKERTLFNIPTIASSSTKNKNSKVIYDYIQSSDENFKKYFNALVNGYEVEMSKEEQLFQLYHERRYSGSDVGVQRATGIKEALTVLGIEIGGINKWTM